MSDENKSENNTSESTPVYSVEEETPNVEQSDNSVPLETVSEDITPEGISDAPPPIYEENRSKLIFIVVGAIIFLVIFIFVVKFILSFGKASGSKVTLKYWGLWEDAAVLQPLIADYKRKNPNVSIIYTKMDHGYPSLVASHPPYQRMS